MNNCVKKDKIWRPCYIKGYDFVTQDDEGNFGPGLGGDTTLIGYYGDPRTVHLTVGYRF